jgi:hypothetical protein
MHQYSKDPIINEFTSKTNEVIEDESILKELAVNHIDKMGIHWNRHFPLFLKGSTIARILYYDYLYRKIIKIPGAIMEFGIQWGTTLSILTSLRGLYEPWNHSRCIYGFDTFEGLTNINSKDGSFANQGDYGVINNYDDTLVEILEIHEKSQPLPHIKKSKLYKGDARITVDQFLRENSHTVISMLILDMDIYEPTLEVLRKLRNRFTKGTVVVFDEINCPSFPGETIALMEEIGLPNIKLRKFPFQTFGAYFVV